jgi:hypothetical protein
VVSRRRFFQASLENRTTGTIRIESQVNDGSSLDLLAGLAQLVERLICNQ